MFDSVQWQEVQGAGNTEDLTLLTLSTCGFCSRARDYLKERGLAFRYLELDLVSPEDKTAVKNEFKNQFGRRPSFPTLVMGREKFLIGFIRQQWDSEIPAGQS